MSIPQNDHSEGHAGFHYAGTTDFGPESGGKNSRSAEIRGREGEDVISLNIKVLAPKGKPVIPLSIVKFNVVNGNQPQIAITIVTPDAAPIPDGYRCQYSFVSVKRATTP